MLPRPRNNNSWVQSVAHKSIHNLQRATPLLFINHTNKVSAWLCMLWPDYSLVFMLSQRFYSQKNFMSKGTGAQICWVIWPRAHSICIVKPGVSLASELVVFTLTLPTWWVSITIFMKVSMEKCVLNSVCYAKSTSLIPGNWKSLCPSNSLFCSVDFGKRECER